MIKINNIDISDIKIAGLSATKVMIGNEIVWQKISADYIQDGLVFQLDGINKGNNPGYWTDLKGGIKFDLSNASNIGLSYIEMDGTHYEGLPGDHNIKIDASSNNCLFTVEVVIDRAYTSNTDKHYIIFDPGSLNNSAAFYDQHKVSEFQITCGGSDRRYNWSLPSSIYILKCIISGTKERLMFNMNSSTATMVNGRSWTSSRDNLAHVGGRGISGSNYAFEGKIYAIRLYNKTLTKEEMLYNQNLDDVRFNLNIQHQHVNLGLPSGTLWATTNIGADYPLDCGLWFQWGDTQGYTSELVGSGADQKYFGWADYKYSENGLGTDSDMTKYNNTDNLATLSPEDDAATVNWGDLWCMPSRLQIGELCDNCTTSVVSIKKEGTVDDYITCIKFTSNINNNELIFPCVGHVYEGSVRHTNNIYIQSSSLDTSKKYTNYELLVEDFTTVYKKDTTARNKGLNIRPVLKQQ